ncbi:MAG: YigZ family protein [Myxococcales bacterium]|nr:YigZ family protein [Myxococcales bacterium]
MAEIVTVAARSRHEIDKIKGSRFFATVAPAATVDDALALVASLRAEFPDATHHCWAWRGRGRDHYRYSDDGEPSGSAGRPILGAVDGRELADVAVVVTRYYGGTKLGTGGLARAYRLCAVETLARVELVRARTTTEVVLRFDYERSGAVQGVLAAHRLEPIASEYGARVELRVAVPDEELTRFAAALRERTAGQVTVEEARR